ncbi:glycosyltransferase family 4 protein [Pseudomonas protegens]|uniref:MraY family glycosyltransferase n=1 Tax=Pseudomonas protegens TaxID=380021 RepID=UPI000F4B6AE6|nr:glycosyltransferase family 4 protein [Pseudomonas protegens]
MILWLLLPAALLCALLMTSKLRAYALSNHLIDVPNSRSSHSVPTPRGGGVSIVLSFSLFLPLLLIGNAISSAYVFALLGAGLLVAVIGFLDDHGHIAARWRLLGHFIAAIWSLYWVGGVPSLTVLGFQLNFIYIGYVAVAFYMVWMLNLYNFMDGIDGLASIQAVTVCLGAALLYWVTGFDELVGPPLLLVFATLGFLYWNFPSARIFMGDAGSGFLGITLAIFSLQAAAVFQSFLWGWLILLGVFIVDATFTLIRRLLRGDKIYEAHRSHAYQYASREVGGHLPVSLAIGGLNIIWLLPMAWLAVTGRLDGVLALIISYIPLIFLAIKYKAGVLEVR